MEVRAAAVRRTLRRRSRSHRQSHPSCYRDVRKPCGSRARQPSNQPRYLAYCLMKNDGVSVYTSSDFRVTGVLSLVAIHEQSRRQERTPGAAAGQRHRCLRILASGTTPGWARIWRAAWSRRCACVHASQRDQRLRAPTISTERLGRRSGRSGSVALPALGGAARSRESSWTFDTDFDHPMESVLMGHPERDMPFCIKRYRITADGRALYSMHGQPPDS